MSINEYQLEVVNRYLELMETIEEAFSYVKERPLIDQVGAAEKMYPDILHGWQKLSETHASFLTYFNEKMEIVESIESFNSIIEDWEQEMPAPNQVDRLTNLLIKSLGPKYNDWKSGMTGLLQKEVAY